MHLNNSSTLQSLKQIVSRTTANKTLQQDLLQEAILHLWLTETRRPDQTTSWYLQSCRFHIQHYMTSGRSIDSTKRSACKVEILASEGEEEGAEFGAAHDSLFSEVSTRDLLWLLSRHLCDHGRAVLGCLADGCGPREIGRRLQISHTMVIKHRSRIARVLERLESSRCRLKASRSHRSVVPFNLPSR
jgi:DNA-directed RNA polymerase specialized sigma24 family protein